MSFEKTNEQQDSKKASKKSTFDIETKKYPVENWDEASLSEEQIASLRMAQKLIDLGSAYVDEEAKKRNILKVKLKKDDSIIYYEELISPKKES